MHKMKEIPWNEKNIINEALVQNYEERIQKSRIYKGLVGGKLNALLFSVENALTYLSEFIKVPLLSVKSERVKIPKPIDAYFGRTILSSYSDELDKVSKRIMLTPDFSLGMEKHPIPVFDDSNSDVISLPEPRIFNYIVENVIEPNLKNSCPIDYTVEDYKISCECKDHCGVDCACFHVGKKINPFECVSLPEQGCIFPRSLHTSYLTIAVFCGDSCNCPPTCQNRISNLINPHRLEIFKNDAEVGYCVRTLTNIQYGEVVCEFVGELKTDDFNEDYAFNLCCEDDEDLRNTLCELTGNYISDDAWGALHIDSYYIDPYKQGNVARLFKHSCLPNMIPIKAICGDWRPQMHRILMVAIAPIAAGTELTFNYGLDYYTKIGKKCKCNSICCGKIRNIWKKMPQELYVGAIHEYISGLHHKLEEMEIRRQRHMGVHDDDECCVIEHINKDGKRELSDKNVGNAPEKRKRFAE